jgi:hypothetical protein
MPNKLKVQRTKPENLLRNLKNPLNNVYHVNNCEKLTQELILKPNMKYDLMIEGLGMIVVQGIEKLIVNTFKNVKLTLLKDWII